MGDEVVKEAKKQMEKAVTAYKSYLKTVKTGRAHIAMFENLKVEAYGQEMTLKQLASISIPDATQVLIQPWDASVIKDIEKAILKSNLGLTPQNDGKSIKLHFPPMTEENRRESVKLLKQEAEKYRVNIRNVRKKANNEVKDMEKDKIISEDEQKRLIEEIQKLTNSFIERIDSLTKEKEKEILSI